ncbi:MAG: type II secretion system protein, partial [Candidatus Avelusimicrobium sp.]
MKKSGFTLIELLVVVLIIGILAAVALPQYEKAVAKSRLKQWNLLIRTAQQATEMLLLETGGFPATPQLLTGKNRIGGFEFTGDCDTNGSLCYIRDNNVYIYCNSAECFISITSSKLGFIAMHDLGSGYQLFDFHPLNNGSAKAVCEWIRDTSNFTVQ